MVELEDLRKIILKAAEIQCKELELDLVELIVRRQNETIQIILLVDLPAGGIGLEACAQLNRRLDTQLYEVLKLGDNYTLEVSSPGLDRPLVTISDFRRAVIRKIHLFLREPVYGKVELIGRLKRVGDAEVEVLTKAGEVLISIDKIEKGHIVF